MKKIVLFLIATVLLFGCGGAKSGKPTIGVTIPPLAYFVKNIAGEQYDVVTMIPSGASPETYEPTIKDMKRVADARFLVAIGAMECEASVIGSTDKGRLVVLNEHFSGKDPHFWLSIQGAKSIAGSIYDKLTETDPANADTYALNYNRVIGQIDSLERYMRNRFDEIPAQRRCFILFHPTLGYIASEQGLEQIAIEKDGKEPTIEQMKFVIETARKKNIKEIFIQREFDSGSIESIRKETRAKAITIEPLSEDWLTNMYRICDTLHYSMRNR